MIWCRGGRGKGATSPCENVLPKQDGDQEGCSEVGVSEAASRAFIDTLSNKARESIVIGLTGKNGSGMTEVSEFLASSKFRHLLIQPADSREFEQHEVRELRLAQRYLRENWTPFVEVSVTAVMMSFVLDVDNRQSKELVYKFGLKGMNCSVELEAEVAKCFSSHYGAIRKSVIERLQRVEASLGEQGRVRDDKRDSALLLKAVNKMLPVGGLGFEELKRKWAFARCKMRDRDFSDYNTVVMCFGVLPALTEEVRSALSRDNADLFSLVFQRVGNSLRAYGKVSPAAGDVMGHGLFALPKRVNDYCLVLRHYRQATAFVDRDCSSGHAWITNPVRIVINCFKNMFEAYYFRQRYSSFYLVAVTSEKSDGAKRRTMRLGLGAEMDYVDLGENLSIAKDAFKQYERFAIRADEQVCEDRISAGFDAMQREFFKEVFENDPLRKECYQGKIAPFILQDVMACVENSDVFVTRNLEEKDVSCDEELVRALARLMVLVMHPALLKPTKIERCMQTAMSTKLNSGCLSRQVGAVVTDQNYNILSLGWNDVPCSVEMCSRKNLYDIAKKYDRKAYSTYELTNPAFREYIDRVNVQLKKDEVKQLIGGLPAAYCFKDIHQDLIGERDQTHTRALHAEDRALAACGNEKARGGYLFTTSSPCENCAKRIKEAGISKIYYIEQYPGISHDHVIDDGPYETRAEFEFFTGIVGLAYTRLYTPLIPYKDELEAMGVSPKLLERKTREESKRDLDVTQAQSGDSVESDRRHKRFFASLVGRRSGKR